MSKVAYCTLTENLNSAIPNLKSIYNYVDETIIIFEHGTDFEISTLEYLGIICIQKDWNDNFSEYRNYYLTAARNLKCDWIFTTDTDEYPSQILCKNIKTFINKALNYDMISFYERNVYKIGSGYIIHPDIRYKQLLFKLYDGVYYDRNVHHELLGHSYTEILADDIYQYSHVKSMFEAQMRWCRDFVIAGGSVDEYPTEWKELHLIESCPKKWHEFRSDIINGTLSQEVKDWIIKYRNIDSTQYVEPHAFFYIYFIVLHPEQNINGETADYNGIIKNTKTLKYYIENQYLEVLNRHADLQGMEFYTNMIENNDMNKYNLAKALTNSDEYNIRLKFNLINRLQGKHNYTEVN